MKNPINVIKKKNFNQVVVWEGTTVLSPGIEDSIRIKEFINFIKTEFKGVRAQYLEEIKTFPDKKNGKLIEGTGGRSDLLFAVHKDDIEKFAVARLAYGMRWIEDVYLNGADYYPERIAEYKTW